MPERSPIDLSRAVEIMREVLVGPACPCCYRTDGSHGLGCPVPEYEREWRRIHHEHSDRVADAVFPETAR